MTWRQVLAGLGRDLVKLAVIAVVFSVLFAAGDLILYGHVRW